MGESYRDDSGQVTLQKRRVIMKVSRVIQNIRICCATGVIRKGMLELSVGLKRRNNQMPMSLNWLKGMKISNVLYVTDRSVGNKDRWIIDSGCSQHISSNRKMFSLYTSVQGREVFMGNSTTSKLIGE